MNLISLTKNEDKSKSLSDFPNPSPRDFQTLTDFIHGEDRIVYWFLQKEIKELTEGEGLMRNRLLTQSQKISLQIIIDKNYNSRYSGQTKKYLNPLMERNTINKGQTDKMCLQVWQSVESI